MYRFNKRIYKHKTRYISLIIICVIIIGLIVYFIIFLSHPKVIIHQSQAVVKYYSAPSSPNQTINEPDFTFSLPKTWRTVTIHSSLYKMFQFQSDNSSDVLDIYQTVIPVNMAVNRELSVQAAGSSILLNGTVSTNCVNFTKTNPNTLATVTSARWQGVNFLCDSGNYERDVVGTGSTAGVNTVVLRSPSLGTQQFFFTFTSYSVQPNFNVFYQVLNSFRLK